MRQEGKRLAARFREEHIGKACQLCRARQGSDTHHVIDRLKANENKLLWLCRTCHLDIAHRYRREMKPLLLRLCLAENPSLLDD